MKGAREIAVNLLARSYSASNE